MPFSFRRLRHRMVAVFLLPMALLAGVSSVLLERLIVRYQGECKAGLARSNQRFEAFALGARRMLSAQSKQVAESKAVIELLTDLQGTRQRLAQGTALPAAQRALLEQRAGELVGTLALDVSATEARDGNLDLLVIIDLEGRPLACQVRPEARAGAEAEEPRDARELMGAERLGQVPLVHTALQALQEGNLQGLASYAAFPDQRLYFALARPLLVKGEQVGMLLVGTRALPADTRDGARTICVRYADAAHVYRERAAQPAQEGDAEEAQAHAASEQLDASLPILLASWKPDAGLPPWKLAAGARAEPCVVRTAQLGGVAWYAAPCALWEAGRDTPLAWAVTCEDDTFLAPLYAVRRTIWQAGAAVLLCSLGLLLGFSVQLSRPLERLAGHMKAVGEGDLEQVADMPGRDEVAMLGAAFNQMVDGLREKRMLAAYVPEKARDAIEGSGGRAHLGPDRVTATIMFADLRGFTTMSERMQPQEVVAVLNEVFVAVQQAIVGEGGYVSDFIGDAVLAVFHGTDGHDGAVHGVRGALAMQAALARLAEQSGNAEVRALHMGMGLHTGVLVEGDVGPPQRLKYTVLGDTVNTAARIQDASKLGTRTHIVLSEVTWRAAQHAFAAESLGEHALKGKAQPVALYEVLGPL